MRSSLIYSSQPRSVATGDLNNDQQIDFVVANSGTNRLLGYLFHKEMAHLQINKHILLVSAESHPRSLAISDFNNDSLCRHCCC